MQIILLGAPGSGKGTQAFRLVESYDLVHISTGDFLRHEVERKSLLGLEAKIYMDQGELVPGEIIMGMIEEKIGNNNGKGLILDGFPRDIPQAEGLEVILKKTGNGIDLVIDIEVDREEILKRIAGRRVCHNCEASYNIHFQPPNTDDICDRCGGDLYQRDDDKEETVKHRLEVYFSRTAPLIDYYRKSNKLKSVDGSLSVDEVFNIISSLIIPFRKSISD